MRQDRKKSSGLKMELLRLSYKYGMQFCFAGLLIFTASSFVGYILAQYIKEDARGMEVQINFGKGLKTLDFILRDPLMNVPWELVDERNRDTFVQNKIIRVFLTMSTDDLQNDLRLFNDALEKLRGRHVTNRQSNPPTVWTHHPQNFVILDMAKGEHMRYISTIAPHENVATLMLLFRAAEDRGRTSVQSLNPPLKHYFEWSTSVKLCREMPENTNRFRAVEESCWGHLGVNTSVPKIDTVETNLIHTNPILKDYPLFMHVIDGGMVDSLGNVYTGSLLIIPFGCNQGLPFSANTNWKVYAKATIEKEVFVMTQFYDGNPTSFLIDSLPRIVPYLEFLLAHKDIKIHVTDTNEPEINQRMTEALRILGIDSNRLIKGHVRSEIIYLPQGGGCKAPNSLMIQLVAQIFHNHMNGQIRPTAKINQALKPGRNVLLMLDSGEYKVHDFDTIVGVAKSFAARVSMDVQVLTQYQLQAMTLSEIMARFRQAGIVFGSANAMMSNVLFCRPGSVVIEVLCSVPYMTLGHLRVAYSLGLRYHAIPGNIGCASGIVVDLRYVEETLEFYMRRFKSFQK